MFSNLLLVDEVNRATPRTQSALLEAMQERQVTVEGVTRPLPDPFLVLATQNPVEFEGTFALPAGAAGPVPAPGRRSATRTPRVSAGSPAATRPPRSRWTRSSP